ncbi:MAG: M23 family metallopeptidase [Desulfobacteraceae bacterium]|nr:M23 family metallopeptidase [Desulfobacteraceae bacterium]
MSAVFFILAFFSYKKAKTNPFFKRLNYKRYISLSIIIVLTGLYSINNFSIIKGLYFNKKPIELRFPLKNGTYYISHGGNSVQINHHYTYPLQKYALDIKKLNQFGVRAKGIIPKQLSRYEIFEEIIYSPCDGEVIKVAGDRPDMVPLEMDKKRPLGNYVAINYKGTIVYLAHMMKGSLLVKKGDRVKVGQPIGKVGNSGNTSEPHLHMHAEHESQGVPVTFNGKFLVRNTII